MKKIPEPSSLFLELAVQDLYREVTKNPEATLAKAI